MKTTLKKSLVKIAQQAKKQPIVSLKFLRLKFRTFSRLLLNLQTMFTYCYARYVATLKVKKTKSRHV